jgi:hypothetical protein
VKNNLEEQSGVHWHGLEIESFPDGVADFSGIGDKIMPPIPPGGMFAAEFTPPRTGTFPYHSHLHEMRQISSGMYGAIVVTDTPRDTTRDHVIVAGGGGLPIFYKQGPSTLLVNGSATPDPIRMTVGDTNRLRIVSIHADEVLTFRFGTQVTGRAMDADRARRRRTFRRHSAPRCRRESEWAPARRPTSSTSPRNRTHDHGSVDQQQRRPRIVCRSSAAARAQKRRA